MAYHIEINNVEVDDYIRDATVPFVSRKRDYTPVFESAKIILDGTYGTPTKNYKVVLFEDTAILWAGFIEDFTYNYKTGAWSLEVRSYLLQLEETLVTYDNLHSYFIADDFGGLRYKAGDNEGYPNLNLRQLFLKVFDAAGLALGLSDVHSQVLFTFNYSSTDYDYDLNTICVDENMIYNLNQNVATLPSVLESDDDYKSNMINTADLVKYFMSVCGFSIRCINDTPLTYELFPMGRSSNGFTNPSNDDFYNLDDDLKYGYKDKVILGNQRGYLYEGNWAARSKYHVASLDALTSQQKTSTNDGQKRIQVYNNLRGLLRDQTGGASAGDVLDTTGNNHWFLGLMLSPKTQALVMNHQKEEITTTIPTQVDLKPTVTKEVFKLSSRTSKIIQETNLQTSG